jgi:alkylation response protein AidB-like acyl-CoA dehydrogenase
MYFDFSKEQYMARDSAREFLAERLPSTRLRELLGTDTGVDRDIWKGLADLGWTAVLVPEEHGGLGLGFLDLALLLEESGRALLPAPLVETAVMLPLALGAASAEQRQRWLPGIASGEVIATVALAGAEGLPLPAGIGVQARASGSGFALSGEALLVPFAGVADIVLVAARRPGGKRRSGGGDQRGRVAAASDDGVSLFIVEPRDRGVSFEPLVGLDPTVRLSKMRLDGVRLAGDRLVGAAGAGWPVLSRVLEAGATALALQAVGGAGRALEMATEYAKVRQQFGKPIGSFQAIKHKCADMLVQYETARSGAYYAAWAVGAGAPDAAVAASMAKAACSEMFRFVTSEAIQVHGGIGFTWEHDLHFYFKRAKRLELTLGTPEQHREVVAAACLTR